MGLCAFYELVIVTTLGDAKLDVSIADIARQGAFTSEVEQAVLEGRADVAVHSAKDLPSSNLPEGLVLACAPVRADVRDVLVGASVKELNRTQGDHVEIATGSVRRRVQLQALIPNVAFIELRGNIATRLTKVPRGGAGVFAHAALDRLGLMEHVAEVLSVDTMLPQVGQGAIALRCRIDDVRCIEALADIDDEFVHLALRAERAYLAQLGGGCDAPVGAYGVVDKRTGEISIEAMLATNDGSRIVRLSDVGEDPEQLGTRLADEIQRVFADPSSKEAS
jgi:hydroxymethylbilane synthase